MTVVEYPRLEEALYQEDLPGGVKLLVLPRRGVRQKTAYLATDFGSIVTQLTVDGEERTYPPGSAHFFEHMIFEMPDGEDVSARFAALGADVNAFTDYDMMAFHFTCTDHFLPCLELLLEFTMTPCFDEARIRRERGVIEQEIAMAEDEPESRTFEAMAAAMYPTHNVRHTILGTQESISGITASMLQDLWRGCFTSGKTVLCVAGDVDPAEVYRVARAGLEKMPSPVSRKKNEPETMPPEHLVRGNMDVAMPSFYLGFRCPPPKKGAGSDREKRIGCLAAEVLLGESSELYLRLYEQGLIDSSFGGAYETMEGVAMLTASGDSRDPEAVCRAVLRRAEWYREHPVEEPELSRLKRSMLGGRIRELDGLDGTCYHICAAWLDGGDYLRFPEEFAAVTAEDVRSFIVQVVRAENCCLSVIDPFEEETYESR